MLFRRFVAILAFWSCVMEHHHAAVQAVWGTSAGGAFAEATFALVLTGTPIRSDGERSVWLAYDDAGTIDHPEEGTYTLTYGETFENVVKGIAWCDRQNRNSRFTLSRFEGLARALRGSGAISFSRNDIGGRKNGPGRGERKYS
jgi:hypothetical protein